MNLKTLIENIFEGSITEKDGISMQNIAEIQDVKLGFHIPLPLVELYYLLGKHHILNAFFDFHPLSTWKEKNNKIIFLSSMGMQEWAFGKSNYHVVFTRSKGQNKWTKEKEDLSSMILSGLLVNIVQYPGPFGFQTWHLEGELNTFFNVLVKDKNFRKFESIGMVIFYSSEIIIQIVMSLEVTVLDINCSSKLPIGELKNLIKNLYKNVTIKKT